MSLSFYGASVIASEYYFPLEGKKTYIAGSTGMVGTALLKFCEQEGCNILTTTRSELDLMSQSAVNLYFEENKPEVVFLVAAYVGGILENMTKAATMISDNLIIERNVIHAAYLYGCQKLVFVGSAAVYPDGITRALTESDLLTGSLDETKRSYALAKIAGIELCRAYKIQHGCDFVAGLPNNIYGPKDNYHPLSGHLLSALIQKVHKAKLEGASSIEIWGSGLPRRELCYVDDVARALIHIAKFYTGESAVNIGTGEDYSITEIANFVCDALDYPCQFTYNSSKPDGTMRRLLDVSLLRSLGFCHEVDVREGIRRAYEWFLSESNK